MKSPAQAALFYVVQTSSSDASFTGWTEYVLLITLGSSASNDVLRGENNG